ncbi:hypothetical protein BDA96_01G578200 [Sorghum bicolor]|uniref:Uncharacterized protein n=1 Tax=Sorghum bicolor TaxID=4558 RepID=A0A921S6Y8_SORBI|nr:hypothetical protein BDA96_01G578200 [Sorghum bicolor]
MASVFPAAAAAAVSGSHHGRLLLPSSPRRLPRPRPRPRPRLRLAACHADTLLPSSSSEARARPAPALDPSYESATDCFVDWPRPTASSTGCVRAAFPQANPTAATRREGDSPATRDSPAKEKGTHRTRDEGKGIRRRGEGEDDATGDEGRRRSRSKGIWGLACARRRTVPSSVTNGGVAAAARHPGSSNGGATAARPAGSIRPAVLQRKLSWMCVMDPCMVGSTRTAPTATASDDDAYADSTPARQRHPPRSSWRKTPKRFWSTSPARTALWHSYTTTVSPSVIRRCELGLDDGRGPLSWLWKDGPLHAGDRAGRRD